MPWKIFTASIDDLINYYNLQDYFKETNLRSTLTPAVLNIILEPSALTEKYFVTSALIVANLNRQSLV